MINEGYHQNDNDSTMMIPLQNIRILLRTYLDSYLCISDHMSDYIRRYLGDTCIMPNNPHIVYVYIYIYIHIFLRYMEIIYPYNVWSFLLLYLDEVEFWEFSEL